MDRCLIWGGVTSAPVKLETRNVRNPKSEKLITSFMVILTCSLKQTDVGDTKMWLFLSIREP